MAEKQKEGQEGQDAKTATQEGTSQTKEKLAGGEKGKFKAYMTRFFGLRPENSKISPVKLYDVRLKVGLLGPKRVHF